MATAAEEFKSNTFMFAVFINGMLTARFGCHECSKPNWLEPFSLILAGLQGDREKALVSES